MTAHSAWRRIEGKGKMMVALSNHRDTIDGGWFSVDYGRADPERFVCPWHLENGL